jgi:hypothetical protein
MIKRAIIFILLTSVIASCGVNESTTSVTEQLGSSLVQCESCRLTSREVTYLKEICASFKNKVLNFKNKSSEFKLSVQANTCAKDVVTTPNNNVYLDIQVSSSQFVYKLKSTTDEYIRDFESDDFGILKELCAKKDESIVKSQIVDGHWITNYSFHESGSICNDASNPSPFTGKCFMIKLAKKTLAGQYIVEKSEIITVINDKTNNPTIQSNDGVVARRERASLCHDKVTTETITQALQSIN